MNRRFKPIAVLAAKAADEKGAEMISLLHTSRLTSLADYLLIVSVGSPAQMEAVEDKISAALKAEHIRLVRREGALSDSWRVLDYGGLWIHLMHPQARDFYSIDKLYRSAPKIHWQNNVKKSGRR